MRRSTAALALLLSGCTLAISYDECKVDTDCPAPDGGAVFCTSDHLCVGETPIERLCPETVTPPGSGPRLVIASLVDRHDDLDRGMEKAIRLAVDEINLLQPGANQPGIELHVCDQGATVDGSGSQRALEHAFSTWGVAAVIGPTATADVVAVTPFARDHGVLVVTPSATSVVLTQTDSNHMVWRTCPSDAFEARKLTSLVASDPAALPTLDVLYADTLDNKGLEQVFFMDFAATHPVHATYTFTEGGMGIDDAIGKIAADGATGLVAISDSDDPAILTSLATQPALAQTHVFMTDAAKSPSLLMTSAPTSLLAHIRGTGPATPTGPTFALFRAAYQDRFGVDPKDSNFSANAYDATYVVAIAAAATKSHVPSGMELSQGMMQLQSTGTALSVGSNDYLNALQAMASGGVRLTGASGPLEFDSHGDLTNGNFEVWAIDTSQSPPAFVTCGSDGGGVDGGACP